MVSSKTAEIINLYAHHQYVHHN